MIRLPKPPPRGDWRGRKNSNDENIPEASAALQNGCPEPAATDPDLNWAKQTAYRLLSLRPRSVREIERKLQEKGFNAATIKEALEKLRELKYLDDASFACQWARHLAVNKRWGDKKISADLQAKGLAAVLINQAIIEARSEITEDEAVSSLIRKKITKAKIGVQDIKEKKRIFRSLLGRGFPAGLILNKLGKIPEDNFHDEDGQ